MPHAAGNVSGKKQTMFDAANGIITANRLRIIFDAHLTREMDVICDPATDQHGQTIAHARHAAIRELKNEILGNGER